MEIAAVYTLTLILVTLAYRLSPWHPLASYPGPLLARTTSLWLTYISSTGKRYLILDALHARYGPFLRIGTHCEPRRASPISLTLTCAGPNALSINSPGAVPIYTNAEKSEMYRYPGHHGGTALFFKQDSADVHRARRRVWSPVFAPGGYVFFHPLGYRARLKNIALCSVADLMPQLERRTVQLLKTLVRRQAESGQGFVDLAEAMYHWAHDFMVRVTRVPFRLTTSSVDRVRLHYSGGHGLWRLQ